MSRILTGAFVVWAASTGLAQAAATSESDKCMSSVGIVKEMLENSDSTEKEKGMVTTLVELSTGLCERKRYEEAEDDLSVARGIMGTEEGAGTDKDDDKKALGKLLTSLVEYAVYHFQTEEKYMDKFKYPDTANHKREHQLFAAKAADVKKRFDEGNLVLSFEITNFVKEWIVNHVMNTDKKYSNCFIENGL